jgi:hypothetical protein
VRRIPAGEVVFELDRFAWTGAKRLEVRGRWYGVRGQRFLRPSLTLTIPGDADSQRALAVLDHKPWPVHEGEQWVAAFPWEGELPSFAQAELEVSPTIAVALPLRGLQHPPPRRRRGGGAREPITAGTRAPRTAAAREPQAVLVAAAPAPPEAPTPPPPSREELVRSLEGEHQRLEQALAGSHGERQRLSGELARAREARDAAVLAQQEAEQALQSGFAARLQELREEVERERALARRGAEAMHERDAALNEAARTHAELEQTRAALEQVARERDELRASAELLPQLRTQCEQLTHERDAAVGAIEQLAQERDAAVGTRDRLVRERDTAARARQELQRELERRDAEPLRPRPAEMAQVTEEIAAVGGRERYPPPPPAEAWPRPAAPPAASDSPWLVRAMVLSALLIVGIVLVIALGSSFSGHAHAAACTGARCVHAARR